MNNQRGILTEEIKALSKELIGYEMCVKELRLMPYIQFCLMNSESININKVNSEERTILMKLIKAGHIKSPSSCLMVSSTYYDIICKIMKVAYCVESIIK